MHEAGKLMTPLERQIMGVELQVRKKLGQLQLF
jgi:hypothetical protein